MISTLSGKKVHILTLGCKVNQYESDAMYEAFFAAGAKMCRESEADICIINTCSVTNIADRKSRQMISRLRKENPDALIVATGCYVQAAANREEADRIGADLTIMANGEHWFHTDEQMLFLENWINQIKNYYN